MMTWLWILICAWAVFMVFVDLVWNEDTRLEKVKVNPDDRYTTDDWI